LKAKVFLSQKFLLSTVQTNVWGRKIQDLYNARYLKILYYTSAALCVCVCVCLLGGGRYCMIIFFAIIT
jgi:hypothetical protein